MKNKYCSILRVFSLFLLFVAAGVGYWHLTQRPPWSNFLEPAINHDSHINLQYANMDSAFLPEAGAHTVHAASLILLRDGNVRAFWFAGSNEGSADVVIESAVFNTKTRVWGKPKVVIDRITAATQLWRYIGKLGNPVPVRAADGKLLLFFVTASIGGWGTSAINVMSSMDEGVSWGSAQRLITSPFLNLSSLVKSPAIAFVDGRLGLPIYHEFFDTFGELLRLESSIHSIRLLDMRRMSPAGGTLQPFIFINNAKSGLAYFRQDHRSSGQRLIAASRTLDAGYTWQVAPSLSLPNPNSAINGLTLGNGDRLLVLNDLEDDRYRLVLAMSQMINDQPSYSPWQIIKILEDDSALPKKQRRRFSYPYMLSDNNGDVHLVYTWSQERIKNAKLASAIKHIRFTGNVNEQA